ncbi:hypothetical protein [uncultured Marinococcus sp.]|jgi:hypothetical protein|uniref:hypothetical protein n=1 Tax=uncultured Marinococcus sp. TaxID=487012 RepID=UPI002628EAD3|nr:hypothetical protein [uncultured Marinococcus sp.]
MITPFFTAVVSVSGQRNYSQELFHHQKVLGHQKFQALGGRNRTGFALPLDVDGKRSVTMNEEEA